MALQRETFRKYERLCSKKAIDSLFENGTSFYCHPFQIIWNYALEGSASPARMAVSVSKKLFKKAVRRNLIKRRIREAYRRNKHILYDFLKSENIKIVFMIIYKHNETETYQQIEKSVIQGIQKLIQSVKPK